MSGTMKKWLMAALTLLVVGGLIFVAAMASSAFDFSLLSTRELETETHELREDFDCLDLHVDTAKLILLPSKDGKCTVVCREDKEQKHTVAVRGGTLVVEPPKEWKSDMFSFGGGSPSVTVYLPKTSYAALTVKTDTGDVEIPADFGFERIEVTGDTADVSCRASASESVVVRTSTGDVLLEGLRTGELRVTNSTGKLELRNAAVSGAVELKSSTGDRTIDSLSCGSFHSESDTGDVRCKGLLASGDLRIKTTTGSVTLEDSDAAELYIRTTTGSVKGNLLTEKVFLCETSTGDVEVPKSITGGRCEISTSTGDIRISTP